MVGSGHRPPLNEWKFPSTPRVATPALEHPPQSNYITEGTSGHDASRAQSPQLTDYFNHPASFSIHTQPSYTHNVLREAVLTPRSPYLGAPTEGTDMPHFPDRVPNQDHSVFQLQQLPSMQSAQSSQTQSLLRGTHSHSQSQDSVAPTSDHSSLQHPIHHPSYLYQLQHDAPQPGHTPLLNALPQDLSLQPHQLQTPSEFALKMLFTQFVKMAETKLNTAIHLPLVLYFSVDNRPFL